MSTHELVAFITAALDDDERIAKAAGERSLHWNTDGIDAVSHDGKHYAPIVYNEGYPTEAEAEHIALHDPARVLAEVEAKRRIVEWCAEILIDMAIDSYGKFGSLKDHPNALAVTLAVETLRLLALPLAARDGYQEKWRPDER